MQEYETVYACHKMLKELFHLQPGESVAITCDSESSMEVVEATATAAHLLGGKPLILKQVAPRGSGKVGDPDMPMESLIGAIVNADIWVEYNKQWLLYSTVYDRVTQAPKHPRYLCLVGATPELMIRNIGKVDFPVLIEFLKLVQEATYNGKHIKVTTPSGTDLEFDNYPGRIVSCSDGQISEPGVEKMLPGQIAWTPVVESINGVMVADGSFSPPIGKLENPIRLTIEKGQIVKFEGDGSDAHTMESWFASFGHKGMYQCAHISYGFGPHAILSGDIAEDERVWGCTEWGFGNTPPLLGMPDGHPCPSHTDCICLNSSLWIDGVQLLDEGKIVGTTPEIVALARKLGK